VISDLDCEVLMTGFRVHSTGPAAPARFAVPERAVANRCVEARRWLRTTAAHRPASRGPVRQPDDPRAVKANAAAGSFGTIVYAGKSVGATNDRSVTTRRVHRVPSVIL
jgi:hypothetical protein